MNIQLILDMINDLLKENISDIPKHGGDISKCNHCEQSWYMPETNDTEILEHLKEHDL